MSPAKERVCQGLLFGHPTNSWPVRHRRLPLGASPEVWTTIVMVVRSRTDRIRVLRPMSRYPLPHALGRGLRATLVGAVVMSIACTPALGECDEPRAKEVIFDVNGYPAYVGQAMVQVSCGNGVFCHSAGIAPARRLGAPHGLDFRSCRLTNAERPPARRRRDRTASESEGRTCLGIQKHVFAEVDSGRMPPGAVGTDLIAEGVYLGLPSIASSEGKSVIENWLACGAPVVERTTEPRPQPGARRRLSRRRVWGTVLSVGPLSRLSQPFVLSSPACSFPRCGNSCHGPAAPSLLAESRLDLSSRGRGLHFIDAGAGGCERVWCPRGRARGGRRSPKLVACAKARRGQ